MVVPSLSPAPSATFSIQEIPVAVGRSLYLIAKRRFDSIARTYVALKNSPNHENRPVTFRLQVRTILTTLEQELSDCLQVNLAANQARIAYLINRLLDRIPVLDTQESLKKMLLREGYSSLNEVFQPRPLYPQLFAADVQSAFYPGSNRLIHILERQQASDQNVFDFRSKIDLMRNLLKRVPGNQKSFKEAARTEIIYHGHTLCSLAHLASHYYLESILPPYLLEEPVPLRIPTPLSPPPLVPKSPSARDLPSPS